MTYKYKIIVDMYETKSESRREWEFEAPMMSSLKGVGDELIITYGELKLRKRIGITKYNNYYLMQDPVETMLELVAVKNPIPDFEDRIILFSGVNYVSVEGLNGEVFLKYIVNSPFVDGLMTKADLKSEIKVLEQEIAMKVTKGNIISEINLTPGEARISADKIALEGYTTINDGFSIDEVGNMTCNDATINGGLVVKDGLYACLVFRPAKNFETMQDIQTIAGLQKTGYYSYVAGWSNNSGRAAVLIPYKLPDNFRITKAEVFVEHQSVNWKNIASISYNGSRFNVENAKVKDLNLFANAMPPETTGSVSITMYSGITQAAPDPYLITKVSKAWGTNSDDYNFGNGYQTLTTIDIKNYLEDLQEGVVGFAPKITNIENDEVLLWESTALMSGTLYIYGMLGKEE